MKRVHSVSDLKAATPKVLAKLNGIKADLPTDAALALTEMMGMAMSHAKEISKDEMSVVAAGVGGKSVSSHIP